MWWEIIPTQCFSWNCLYFHVVLKDIISRYGNYTWQLFSFSISKNGEVFFSGFQGFRYEICCPLNGYFFAYYYFAGYLWLLSRFFPVFSSRSLIMMPLSMSCLVYILFSIQSASWICRFCVFANLRSFWPLFHWMLFQFSLYPLLLVKNRNVTSFVFVLLVHEILLIFSGYFLQIFRLHKFYWSILKLISSSIITKDHQWVLFVCVCDLFFSYICFTQFLINNFYFFAEIFYILFA